MQYFKEHFNDNISETGILQKINDEFYIDDNFYDSEEIRENAKKAREKM